MMSEEFPPSFQPGRRWSIGLNVLTSLVALTAIVVMVNYLAARHYTRIEAVSDVNQELTPVTLRLLQGLTNKVKVIVFFDRGHALFEPVTSLLSRYQAKSPLIEVEQVDHVRYPARAEQILAQFKQDPNEKTDRVIFESSAGTRTVYESELSEYDNAAEAIMTNREIKRTAFRGEQLFSAAIFRVADPRPVKAYFLQGHGEHSPTNTVDQVGYSAMARLLEENNVQVGTITLTEGDIPADCQLLVVAGARDAIPRFELEKVDKYLAQGGRLLLLFSYFGLDTATGLDRTGLHRLMAGWGVEVGQNHVFDRLQGQAGTRQYVLVGDYGAHPIVGPLRYSRVQLFLPRSLRPRSAGASGADAPKVTDLLLSGPEAVALRIGDTPRPEATAQTFPLAVAVEKGSIQGLGSDRGATRIVAVGDSLFLRNTFITAGANRDFARNAINWLVSREMLLEGIGPRAIAEYKVTMTVAEMRAARWMMLVLLPGAVLLLGGMVWLRRRR